MYGNDPDGNKGNENYPYEVRQDIALNHVLTGAQLQARSELRSDSAGGGSVAAMNIGFLWKDRRMNSIWGCCHSCDLSDLSM